MAFNSIDYIVFLAVAFWAVWFVAKFPSLRLTLLLIASYAFYTMWNGTLVLLIALSSAIDYICGHCIARYAHSQPLRRLFLAISLVANLGLLGFFKYANFFIDNANTLMVSLGTDPTLVRLDILLPVGISFYTFQSMSYTLDIYRGELKPIGSLRNFLLFVSFFPQLIAGPIVRAREFLPQLARPAVLTDDHVGEGVFRILRGLIKKMVIADYLAGTMVDPVFATPELFTSTENFVALVAFHFQVYNDFSGYTDIALGSARLFGFTLPDNFNRPYAAHTPGDYWRRWHMTLSRFCFDYIYRPLGGSKKGPLRTYVNTFITFSIIGFWHGASWNYVLFGVYHAVFVGLGRVILGLWAKIRKMSRTALEESLQGKVLPILITNIIIIFSLPLFRSPDMQVAYEVYDKVAALDGWQADFPLASIAMLVLAIWAHYIPNNLHEILRRQFVKLSPLVQAPVVGAIVVGLHEMAMLAQQSFVYFEF